MNITPANNPQSKAEAQIWAELQIATAKAKEILIEIDALLENYQSLPRYVIDSLRDDSEDINGS